MHVFAGSCNDAVTSKQAISVRYIVVVYVWNANLMLYFFAQNQRWDDTTVKN